MEVGGDGESLGRWYSRAPVGDAGGRTATGRTRRTIRFNWRSSERVVKAMELRGTAGAGSEAGDGTQATRGYREILPRPNVDAVPIATRDHWRMQAAVDTMKVGKDVRLEKSMFHVYGDGPGGIVETARHSRQIVQVGSQRVNSLM